MLRCISKLVPLTGVTAIPRLRVSLALAPLPRGQQYRISATVWHAWWEAEGHHEHEHHEHKLDLSRDRDDDSEYGVN